MGRKAHDFLNSIIEFSVKNNILMLILTTYKQILFFKYANLTFSCRKNPSKYVRWIQIPI